MSADSTSAWATVPWAAVEDGAKTIGWHKHLVPYKANALSLQNLDVWLPASGAEAPDAANLPSRPGRWIVFVHGGAWRDPMVTSAAFGPTVQNLLKRAAGDHIAIAGLASINYRLSSHPNHAADPAREASHPDHISDVLTALTYLQGVGGATDGYILSGHSCGATLAFQAVMDPKRWALGLPEPAKPAVLIGLDGLYDLAGFIADPPASHAALREGYEDFTRGAFGDDQAVWKAACPTTAEGWTSEWTGAKKVVLVQSREDGLVPYNQLEGLRAYLKVAGAGFEVQELEAGGDHDEMWQKGDRMAEIYEEVLKGL